MWYRVLSESRLAAELGVRDGPVCHLLATFRTRNAVMESQQRYLTATHDPKLRRRGQDWFWLTTLTTDCNIEQIIASPDENSPSAVDHHSRSMDT